MTLDAIYQALGKNVKDNNINPMTVKALPSNKGLLGPNDCNIISPTRIIINTATRYVSEIYPVS